VLSIDTLIRDSTMESLEMSTFTWRHGVFLLFAVINSVLVGLAAFVAVKWLTVGQLVLVFLAVMLVLDNLRLALGAVIAKRSFKMFLLISISVSPLYELVPLTLIPLGELMGAAGLGWPDSVFWRSFTILVALACAVSAAHEVRVVSKYLKPVHEFRVFRLVHEIPIGKTVPTFATMVLALAGALWLIKIDSKLWPMFACSSLTFLFSSVPKPLALVFGNLAEIVFVSGFIVSAMQMILS